MKRIALAVTLVVMAADSAAMSDSMKADTTHHMAPDTAKTRP